MRTGDMIRSHPAVKNGDSQIVIACVEECLSCAQACTSCADACLAEDMVADLRQCIRLNLDCADICTAVAAIASRRTGSNHDVLEELLLICADACKACATECERHAKLHKHCQICADACRACQDACRAALADVDKETQTPPGTVTH